MLNNDKLSKYVFAVPFDNERTILYNSVNSAVVLVENNRINNNFDKLTLEDNQQLEKMGFLKSAVDIDREIKETYINFKSDILTILIELTQACNLQCPYCYQSDWKKTSSISDETIERTLIYIKNCIGTGKYLGLDLGLFGGEALLEQDKILTIYEKLKKLCRETNVVLRPGIDTNGVLLKDKFLKNFDALQVNISLTPQKDHDAKRPMRDNSGTYKLILDNLRSCRGIFNSGGQHTLGIRYNTDHENKDYFADFVNTIAAENIQCTIKTAYTHEHTYNPYKNLLPLTDYKIWNSSEVIDVLVNKGFKIRHKPSTIRTPCTGYAMHNLKIFSDGYLGMCNGYFPAQKKVKIETVAEDIDRVVEFFPEKQETPFDNENCAPCKELVLCGGIRFCKQKPCEYSLVDLPTYLRTYVKHMITGNSKYFDFFKY